MSFIFWANAELSRSRRTQRSDEVREQQSSNSRKKQNRRRLSAPLKM